MRIALLLSSSLLALGLGGCPDREVAELPPISVGQTQKDIPVSAEIDLLFVIDNSGSTEDKQTVFAQNFRHFVDALDAFDRGRPNLHIGVVSSTVDLGVSNIGNCPSPNTRENGLLHSTPRDNTCYAPADRYIVDVARPDGSRIVNYNAMPGSTNPLADTLSCIAQIGATGCGFEAPLEAMRRALDGSRPENAGFLRPNAFLVVVFLVDEDDASIGDAAFFNGPAQTSDFRAQPLFAYRCDQAISPTQGGTYTNCRVRTDSFLTDPGIYADFLATIVPRDRTVVALIGGDPKPDIRTGRLDTDQIHQELALLPSCMATINGRTAIGRPANRIMDFVSRYGDAGLFRTICQPDYRQALADIGALINAKVSPCLEGRIAPDDLDSVNPGVQLDCTVSDIQIDREEETPIARCAMADAETPRAGGARPCWWVAANPEDCSATPTHLELRVERSMPAAPNTNLRVRCATQPQ